MIMKKVAIIGIQGVPAKYGGFESLVENIIGENCADGVKYTVFCSATDMPEGTIVTEPYFSDVIVPVMLAR